MDMGQYLSDTIPTIHRRTEW